MRHKYQALHMKTFVCFLLLAVTCVVHQYRLCIAVLLWQHFWYYCIVDGDMYINNTKGTVVFPWQLWLCDIIIVLTYTYIAFLVRISIWVSGGITCLLYLTFIIQEEGLMFLVLQGWATHIHHVSHGQ